MEIIGKEKNSIVYIIDNNICLKKTVNYEKDAFYKIAKLPEKIRIKHYIVPIFNTFFEGKKASCLMKRLYTIGISQNDKNALIEFSDYHNAIFEDEKLKQICIMAKSLLNEINDCELDLHFNNIMQDENGKYYLTDPMTITE